MRIHRYLAVITLGTFTGFATSPGPLFSGTSQCQVDRNILQAQVNSLERQVRSDQAAIQRLGLYKRAEDFEEWERLASDAQEDLYDQTWNTAMDLTLDRAQRAIERLGSMDFLRQESLIAQLERAGVNNKWLFDRIRQIRRIPDAKGKADVINQTITWLKRGQEATSDVAALVAAGRQPPPPHPYSFPLEGYKTILTWLLDEAEVTPGLGLLITNMEHYVELAYFALARSVMKENVTRLYDVTELELIAVRRLSCTLGKHANEIRVARRDLTRCGSDPRCDLTLVADAAVTAPLSCDVTPVADAVVTSYRMAAAGLACDTPRDASITKEQEETTIRIARTKRPDRRGGGHAKAITLGVLGAGITAAAVGAAIHAANERDSGSGSSNPTGGQFCLSRCSGACLIYVDYAGGCFATPAELPNNGPCFLCRYGPPPSCYPTFSEFVSQTRDVYRCFTTTP